MELNTISDSKERFYKEFPYVIPHVFRKVADELLVELHLLCHQEKFKADILFSLGFTNAYEALTEGYKPKDHLPMLFNALCKCNNLNPEEIRTKSSLAIEKSKEIKIEDINKFVDEDKYELSIFSNENGIYNRLTAVGIYSVVSIISNKDNNQTKEEINKVTINISKKLGFPIERVEKDLSVYQGSVDKLKQAIELIKFLNKSD